MKKNNKKTIKVCGWDLSPEDIFSFVLHVGDHAGAQGHTRRKPLEYAESCSECIKVIKKAFPNKGW